MDWPVLSMNGPCSTVYYLSLRSLRSTVSKLTCFIASALLEWVSAPATIRRPIVKPWAHIRAWTTWQISQTRRIPEHYIPFEQWFATWTNFHWRTKQNRDKNILVPWNDSASYSKTRGPASENHAILMTICPFSKLFCRRHVLPAWFLGLHFLVKQTHTVAFPECHSQHLTRRTFMPE